MTTVRLRYRANVLAGQAPSGDAVHDQDDGIIGLPFIQGNAEFGDRHPTPRLIASDPPKIAPRGSILLSVRAPVGAMNVADQRLGIGRGIVALTPNEKYDAGFLWWVLHAQSQQLSALAVGSTYDAVSAADIGSLAVPDAPLLQQREIADFLDRECARIDELAAELARTAHVAVEPALATLALELAGCPIVRVGYRFEVQLGKMLDASRVDAGDTLPYLRNANVYWDRFDLRDLNEMTFSAADRRLYRLRPGDLLVCEGRHVGRSAVWSGEISEMYFQKALHRVRARAGDSTRFLSRSCG